MSLLLMHAGAPTVSAEPTSGITLTLAKTHNAPTPVPSGQAFTFTLAYGWSGGAPGTLVITDTLPLDFDVISTLPASTGSGNTVIFTLTGLTASAGAGTVQINARFKRGTTCDGAVACNDASIVVSGDPTSTVKSNQVCLRASAQNKWTFAKHLFAGCAVDNDVIFMICITQPSGGSIGGLNLTNLTLTDVLPPGAVVTSVSGTWNAFVQSGTTVTFTGGPTSLPVSTWNTSYCVFVHVTFPSPTFTVGQSVTNTATLTYHTPCDGGTLQQFTGSASVTLCAANPSGSMWKGLSINMAFPANNPNYAPTFSPGCCGTYTLSYYNNGNVPQPAPFDIVDDVPQELDVKTIRTNLSPFSAIQVDAYTWTGSGPCTLVTGGGFPLTYPAGTGLQQTSFPLPANICKVRWRYASPIPVAAGVSSYLDVCVRANGFMPPNAPVLAGQNVINKVTAPNNLPAPISATNTKPVDGFAPHILASKFFVGSWGPNCQLLNAGPFVPGNTVRWRMAVANVGNANAAPCTITDVLPPFLTYAGNPTYFYGPVNWMANAWNPPCTSMTAVVPPQIGGTITSPSVGATNLAWTFPTLPFRCDGTVEYLVVEFDTLIGSAPPAPPGNYPNSFTFSAGNLATSLTSNVATLTVNGTAQLTLLKEVRALPSGTFGAIASVPAGSSAEFRLRLTNTGNLPLTSICLLDVMPHVGDVSVLSGTSTYPARSSAYDLPCSGAVVPSLGGFTAGYNNSANTKNPTRSTTCAGFCGTPDPTNGVPAMTPGNWVAAPLTTFSFTVNGGTTALAPAGVLDVLVPATVPSGTPAGAVACDNFGVKAVPVGTTTCLVTQSNPACVKVLPPVDDGKICVEKYADLNGNGVRDPGEPGLAGVTFVVTNANGIVTMLTTPASGVICHPGVGLPAGAYTVSELAHPGWTPTTPVTQTLPYTTGQTTTFVFGNKRCLSTGEPGRLCIHKWNDLDGDGVRDPLEPTLPNWQFTVTGPNGFSQTVSTAGHGVVCIPVPPGTYTVVETAMPNWTATTPTTQVVGVAPGQTTDVWFGNRRPGKGELCVHKWHDLNGDGVQDPGEPDLAGWHFTVTLPSGLQQSVVTGPKGVICFGGIAGSYTIVEAPQAGWIPTTPTTQVATVTAGQVTTVDFGNRRKVVEPELGKFCVRKFLDLDGDGSKDAGEPPLAGWTFQVKDASGAVVATITTNAQGVVCIPLPVGTYTVVEVPQPGYTATTPMTQTATVVAGQTVNVTFGNRKGGGGGELGKLCVLKFLDENRNGRQDPGEPPLPGWTFQVKNTAGAVVATITTGPQGSQCTALPAGTYTVLEGGQAGYTATTPTTQTATVVAGQTVTVTFGNRKSGGGGQPDGELCVRKFLDANGNGVQDRGEPPLAGWTFRVTDASGAVVATLTTDAEGIACTKLRAGPYRVGEASQPGYTATTPTTQNAIVAPRRTANLVFGNRKGR